MLRHYEIPWYLRVLFAGTLAVFPDSQSDEVAGPQKVETEMQDRVEGKHLDTNEEAGGAVGIGHGGNREHVPERLAVLLIVEDAHGGLLAVLHSMPQV